MTPIQFMCAVCTKLHPSLSGVIECYETDLDMLRTMPHITRSHLWPWERIGRRPLVGGSEATKGKGIGA